MRRIGFAVTTLGMLLAFSACTPMSAPPNVNAVPVISTNTNAAPAINVNSAPVPATNTNTAVAVLTSPLDQPTQRITKKFFGTYVTPKYSPVQPERFTGYHTGLDFETFANEAKLDVPVVAACSGQVRAVQTVSGYGGVLVQQCVVEGQTVSALYGHLRLSSVTVKVGTTLNAGTKFAVLGTGFSSETSGERKHLHFSLHKGTAIVWKGYVSTKGALVDWFDPLLYLSKT